MKKRVALLASGGGSNAEALLKAMREPGFPAEPVLVFCNRPGAGVLERAARFGVPSLLRDHKAYATREAFDAEAVRLIRESGADLLCLAGYTRILTPEFTRAFEGRILNVHPSLLPKFGGPGMFGRNVHAAVLAAHETESGATVHWVNEGVDSGAPILQKSVPVLPGDTPESLAARVLAVEHVIFPEALRKVCSA
ncbi:MAG TPA: phosphoribosylglycinamide formyltransferase [bacterium]|jgi:phosphoribosylglycinamide formyltransferase-1|nr:phosphoribosylglycinamide formyltransferase [bacterium]